MIMCIDAVTATSFADSRLGRMALTGAASPRTFGCVVICGVVGVGCAGTGKHFGGVGPATIPPVDIGGVMGAMGRAPAGKPS